MEVKITVPAEMPSRDARRGAEVSVCLSDQNVKERRRPDAD